MQEPVGELVLPLVTAAGFRGDPAAAGDADVPTIRSSRRPASEEDPNSRASASSRSSSRVVPSIAVTSRPCHSAGSPGSASPGSASIPDRRRTACSPSRGRHAPRAVPWPGTGHCPSGPGRARTAGPGARRPWPAPGHSPRPGTGTRPARRPGSSSRSAPARTYGSPEPPPVPARSRPGRAVPPAGRPGPARRSSPSRTRARPRCGRPARPAPDRQTEGHGVWQNGSQQGSRRWHGGLDNPVPAWGFVSFQALPGTITLPLSTCGQPVNPRSKIRHSGL
jgi:hypothetical protein